MNQNDFFKKPQIVGRVVGKIKGWNGWKICDWPFRILVTLYVVIFLFSLFVEPTTLIFAAYMAVLSLFAINILYRITKPWFLWMWESGIGKIVIGFFSFAVIAIARVMADYQIVTTTDAPALLFPVAQDVLILLFSILMWFNVGIALMSLFIVLSQPILGVLSLLRINVEYKSPSDRCTLAFKLIISWWTVLFMFAVINDETKRMKFTITEHTLVWSSFVMNSAVPVHLMPPAFHPRPAGYPDALHHCPLQPKEAWVAFVTGDNVEDDEVVVALPSTGTRNAFTFVWGKCGALNRGSYEGR